MAALEPDELSIIAQRLDQLFDNVRRPNGRRYSYRQVAKSVDKLREQFPHLKPVTAAYIWKLVSGRIKNPSFAALESLAKFFDVQVTYFSESPEEEPQQFIYMRQLSDQRTFDITAQVATLSQAEQEMLLEMMQTIVRFREKEQA